MAAENKTTTEQAKILFLASLRRGGYSNRTVSAYAFDIDKLFVFISELYNKSCQDIYIDEITRDDLRSWIDSCITAGNTPRTVSRKVATVKSFFGHLIKENLLDENPASMVVIPKTPKRLPSSLSQDEILQLLSAPDMNSPDFLRDRAILAMMYGTGLRVSELVTLKMGNIHLDARTVRLEGKGAKDRILPLPDTVHSALLNYFSKREEACPDSVSPKSWAFITRRGNQMTVRMIQYMVQKYGIAAGIASHVHPHLIRHSIASHLVEEGCHIEAVRQTLGHEDLATTSIYLKTSSKFLRTEHDKFNPANRLMANSGNQSATEKGQGG